MKNQSIPTMTMSENLTAHPPARNNHCKTIGALLALGLMSATANAQLVDDFSGGLGAYTLTPVLYSGGSVPATTTISFSDSSGALQATAANYSNIEQALFLRDDYSLSVGSTLRVDVNWSLGNSQDLGLCVASIADPPAASTDPLGNTRTSLSYAFVGIRSDAWHIVSSGFDGSTALSTLQYQPGSGAATSLFVTRTSATTFDLGYNMGAGDVILGTYTFANSLDVGDAIGFYADMRGNGSIGMFDNLRIEAVPEPATLALCGLGLAGWLAVARRKK